MNKLEKLTKKELQKKLNSVVVEIAKISFAITKTREDVAREKRLWILKREILARLNPINELV